MTGGEKNMLKHTEKAGPEGPPGRPEAWRCRKCDASVPNKLPTCPNCGSGR